jgi:hypothetical protein
MVQLSAIRRSFVSQSSEFCRHKPLCCFSTSVYCCCLFRYGLSPETFGYTPVYFLSICLEQMKKTKESRIKISGDRTEIRDRDFPNTKQECQTLH